MDEETPLQRFFRYVIIALLFCGVIWGFWLQNERRVGQVKKPTVSAPSRADATGTLSAAELRLLDEYGKRFREVYGLKLAVVVQDGFLPDELLTPDEKAGTVLLALSPKHGQVVFELPPLAEAAIGEPVIDYLRYRHFPPYFKANTWPEGLAAALNLLTARLDGALRAKEAVPQP